MESKEIKEQFEALVKSQKEVIEKAVADAKKAGEMSEATEKELKSVQEQVKAFEKTNELIESQKEQLKAMQDQLDAVEIKASREEKNTGDFKSNLRKALAEHAEKLKAMNVNTDSQAKALSNAFNFQVKGNIRAKVAGDMTTSGNVTGEVPQALLVPGLNTIRSRAVRLLDLVAQGAISSNLVRWAYQANKDGAAGQTAEGTPKNQIDFDILTSTENVVKTTAYVKVSDEMIDDIDFIESEINNELLRELLKKVEDGVYDGDGTGNNLHGIRDVASAFTAGNLALAVDNANIVDVLINAKKQIRLAEHDYPTAILMNPEDLAVLETTKVSSSDKRYVERLTMVAGQMRLDGIPIIDTTLVDAGEYLIGDFNRAFVLQRSGVNIEVGLDGNDFTENLRTIRAEWRGVSFVKNNDRTAFVAGVFATDQAALETA